jgi:hypothetical protein
MGSVFIAYPMLNPPMYAREATLHLGGSALDGVHERDKHFLKSGGQKGCGSTRQEFPSLVDPGLDSCIPIL